MRWAVMRTSRPRFLRNISRVETDPSGLAQATGIKSAYPFAAASQLTPTCTKVGLERAFPMCRKLLR